MGTFFLCTVNIEDAGKQIKNDLLCKFKGEIKNEPLVEHLNKSVLNLQTEINFIRQESSKRREQIQFKNEDARKQMRGKIVLF